MPLTGWLQGVTGPVELALPVLAPPTPVHTGRRTAVATAEVVDADGRAIAVAPGSGLVTERP